MNNAAWLRLDIAARTKIPPCGAGADTLKAPTIAPAMADPITLAGITLVGSAAAKGMAPSVIKLNPKM